MQIRHHGLGALCFQKLHQMVVGSGQEFYQDLADDADPGLFASSVDRKVVKVLDDVRGMIFLNLPSGNR